MNVINLISSFVKIKKIKEKITSDFLKIAYFMPERSMCDHFDELDYFVMALEDRRFLKHNGVDFISVAREVFKFLTKRKHGGASTIDMQMVRTITGFKDSTLNRKLYEMILSIIVNRFFTKHQIIKCYLNNAFFGSGLYGYKAACYAVYHKELDLISFEEKAFIAAMLLRPKPLEENERWLALVTSRALYAQEIYRIIIK
ncbi:transglycosylase domain-containing protein [Enterobacter asburiae]|nr:transglycosylase domain-containing protein [Enterobacter asburiae]